MSLPSNETKSKPKSNGLFFFLIICYCCCLCSSPWFYFSASRNYDNCFHRIFQVVARGDHWRHSIDVVATRYLVKMMCGVYCFHCLQNCPSLISWSRGSKTGCGVQLWDGFSSLEMMQLEKESEVCIFRNGPDLDGENTTHILNTNMHQVTTESGNC